MLTLRFAVPQDAAALRLAGRSILPGARIMHRNRHMELLRQREWKSLCARTDD